MLWAFKTSEFGIFSYIIINDNHKCIVYYLQLYLNYYSCKCYFASSLKWYSHGHVVKKFLYGIAKTIVILLAWVMMPFRIWSVYISGVLYQTKMFQYNILYLFHRNYLVLSLSLPSILWAKTICRLFVFLIRRSIFYCVTWIEIAY